MSCNLSPSSRRSVDGGKAVVVLDREAARFHFPRLGLVGVAGSLGIGRLVCRGRTPERRPDPGSERGLFREREHGCLHRYGQGAEGEEEPGFIARQLGRSGHAQQLTKGDVEVAREVVQFVEVEARIQILVPLRVGMQKIREPGRRLVAVVDQAFLGKLGPT